MVPREKPHLERAGPIGRLDGEPGKIVASHHDGPLLLEEQDRAVLERFVPRQRNGALGPLVRHGPQPLPREVGARDVQVLDPSRV